jgi:two-component system chemotaxis response regulator CheB
MVVDDSAVIRGLIARILEADPELEVVSSVGNGEMALSALRRAPVDVIVLDIEMPVMDGLTALPKLIAASPGTQVIMASTLTKANAEVSLKAMQMGAADYVAKPSAIRDIHGAGAFRRDLLEKVRTLAAAARQAGVPRPAAAQSRPAPRPAAPATPSRISLRDLPANFRPGIIAIGSSTGGPQALFELLGQLSGQVRQPIVVTQHMPATFTTILAEHIARQCRMPAIEARDGEVLAGGTCYVAPGNFHMTVDSRSGGGVIRLNQDPPENFCRPSVDVMLRSVVRSYGRNVLAVILTGMGQDGLNGCRALVEAGGAVMAQDQSSSVVWGMPGAVAGAGLCSAVLPVKEMGPAIRKLLVRAAA